jgi:hypothetical protein
VHGCDDGEGQRSVMDPFGPDRALVIECIPGSYRTPGKRGGSAGSISVVLGAVRVDEEEPCVG